MLQFLMLVIAVTLIAFASSQFFIAGLSFKRVHKRFGLRRAHMLKSLRHAAEIARLDSELQTAGKQPGSIEWRVMEVAEVVDESLDCRSFYLVDPYRQNLPNFHPGQYLMVRPATAGAFQATRCYSLSSSPDSRYWRITVKRQDNGDGAEAKTNSGLSAWLHAHIHAGDCLLVGGPSGHFFLPPESKEPLVLLAAGVGITPMASMLRWSMEHTPERPVALLYQAQDSVHWPLGESLHGWLDDFPSSRMISYFSRTPPTDLRNVVDGKKREIRSGKFTAADAVQALSFNNCSYYLCGPDSWMEHMRAGLTNSGIALDQIHWESFGGGATISNETPGDTNASFKVHFEASNLDAQWQDREQTLWELARAHGVDLPSGCLSGACGSCRVRLLSGQVSYDRKIAVELDDDECLTCIAQPKSDLRIDA